MSIQELPYGRGSALSKLRWKRAQSFVVPVEEILGFEANRPTMNAATSSALSQLAVDPMVPDIPEELTAKGKAIGLLRAAAEIEHALMSEYLYAYFTLNPASKFSRDLQPPPHNTNTHADDLLQIAIEEMGHLMTVQNLLLALGADWHFDLQPIVFPPDGGPGFPFPYRLAPLTKGVLAKYVDCESPADKAFLSESDRKLMIETIEPLAREESGGIVNHVGNLYLRLNWLFQRSSKAELPGDLGQQLKEDLGDIHLEDDAFDMEKLKMQADPDDWVSGKSDFFFVAAVSGQSPNEWRESAREAIRRVGEQGENANADDRTDSHFERFLRMFRNHPGDDAVRIDGKIAMSNPRLAGDPVGWGDSSIEIGGDADVLDWAKFFRLRYELLITVLGLYLELPPNSAARAAAHDHALKIGMRNVIRAGAKFLASKSQGDSFIGPPFLLPRPLPVRERPSDDLAQVVRERVKDLINESAPLRDKINLPGVRQADASLLVFI